jgi:hypothetical protein
MFLKLGVVSFFLNLAVAQTNPCVSYGVDYQDGKTYFQNVLLNDPFTFVSMFEGCQNDTAQNVLVDPSGNQYLCSDTTLTPSDTPEMSTWYVKIHGILTLLLTFSIIAL